VKITKRQLKQIITEEVIKEEVAPEDATRTIIALLQGTPPKVTGDIMGAVYDEMYDADVSEPEPEPEEDYPTEYQPGGTYGDRPQIGFEEGLTEIIEEELTKVLNEGCPHDPLQQLADQLGIDSVRLADAMEQMGLSISPMEMPPEIPSEYEDYSHEEPMMENLAPEKDIADIRQQVDGMSYEIEKMLVALLKAGYSPEDIINMAVQIKQMDLHPEDVQVAEAKEKDNPWAICTASVGREDKEKYEKCVKSVKKEKE
jgi:hypothetical protein